MLTNDILVNSTMFIINLFFTKPVQFEFTQNCRLQRKDYETAGDYFVNWVCSSQVWTEKVMPQSQNLGHLCINSSKVCNCFSTVHFVSRLLSHSVLCERFRNVSDNSTGWVRQLSSSGPFSSLNHWGKKKQLCFPPANGKVIKYRALTVLQALYSPWLKSKL